MSRHSSTPEVMLPSCQLTIGTFLRPQNGMEGLLNTWLFLSLAREAQLLLCVSLTHVLPNQS